MAAKHIIKLGVKKGRMYTEYVNEVLGDKAFNYEVNRTV